MAEEKKKYNLTIAPLWEGKFGGYYTFVKDEAFDALQTIEKGGMLVIRQLKAESRKSDKSPHAYLEYKTKEEVEADSGLRSGSTPPRAKAVATDEI